MKHILYVAGAALALVAVYACGDDTALDPADGGVSADGSTVPPDATVDANETGPARRTSCLDRPGLPRPPVDGRLPCDLIPPGVTL